MKLPTSVLECMRVGLGAAALAAAATGCAAAPDAIAPSPFPGSANAPAQPVAPVAAQPAVAPPSGWPGAHVETPPARAVTPTPTFASPPPQPEPEPRPARPPRAWECGPCGMG